MNDLRTAAQAVLDDFQFMKNAIDEKLWKSIEALRQALDAPVEPVAPVAWINVEKRKLEWNTDFPVRWETPTVVKLDKLPLYTTPPSVDALIAEIDALDRHGDDADFIYGWDINPILDKYRGQK